jgi:hypothetical protein
MSKHDKNVDIHHEPFGNKKHNAIPTSLSPPHKTRYFDVWPTTLNIKDGPTLVIGTQTFNALITSSIQLGQTTSECDLTFFFKKKLTYIRSRGTTLPILSKDMNGL